MGQCQLFTFSLTIYLRKSESQKVFARCTEAGGEIEGDNGDDEDSSDLIVLQTEHVSSNL